LDKYQVIRDSQEKANYWTFSCSKSCEGTEVKRLKTGDYTLVGLENVFTIERKGCIAEFAQNISQKRFERELKRLEKFKYPFILLEFTLEDIMRFPYSSNIPQHLWAKLRVNPSYILKRLLEYQLTYKTKILLVGAHGKEVASSLFKRVYEKEC
jgi:ERCC4-type nuclease